MVKKISKKLVFILIIVFLGGLGGIVADRYVFPYLSATQIFSKYNFLKKSTENVTVINRTEQVYVKEETSINKISSNASASVANIIVVPDSNAKNQARTGTAEAKNTTGIVVTSDGIIMGYAPAAYPENTKFKVLIHDGGIYEAEFLAADSYSNLFFLKINSANLPAISFGDTGGISPGEKIIAIGNSLPTYSNIYAAGLLSNFESAYNLAGKTLSSSEKLEGVFRTDFNSGKFFVGGPVVDYTGQTIGVQGSVEKNGKEDFFVIPAEKVKRVIEKAIRKDSSKNAVLGIYYVPLSKTYALANNIGTEKGALIYSPSGQQGLAIIAGSPAQKAGLMINDIIVAINDAEVDSNNPFSDLLYRYVKGDEVELAVLRAGKELKIKVQL